MGCIEQKEDEKEGKEPSSLLLWLEIFCCSGGRSSFSRELGWRELGWQREDASKTSRMLVFDGVGGGVGKKQQPYGVMLQT